MDSTAYAQQLIAEAIADEATHLDLAGLDLVSLPPEIGEASALTHLSVRDNGLTTLPPEIGRLTQLIQLSLANNELTSLPDELAHCRELVNLNLKNNRLTTLGDGVLKLERLDNLQLAGNPLPLPPEVIARWNRPQDIIAFYREKFPPVIPPPPPPRLLDLVMRTFTSVALRELADMLTVPAEELLGETELDLAEQFITYHIAHGLEAELRELLQIWAPQFDWARAVHPHSPSAAEPDETDDGHKTAA